MIGELEHANADLHQVLQVRPSVLQDSRDFQLQFDAFSLGLCKLAGLVKILRSQQLQLGSLLVDDFISCQEGVLGLGQDDGSSGVQLSLVLLFGLEKEGVPVGAFDGDQCLGSYSFCGAARFPPAALAGVSRALC
jgi:hypothetical protein